LVIGGVSAMARSAKSARVVFVSQSSKDTWVAKQIAAHISRCGARPFLDEADIEVGADFEEEILEFLEKADELVVLMTPWALDRPYVWAELGAAWSRRIPIVILLQGRPPGSFNRSPASRSSSRGGTSSTLMVLTNI
jgi:hypothetical protein